jgi:shikimate kinase
MLVGVNISVIGMRGAGKSNVSRRLSVFTKRPVFATDTMVEYEAGGRTVAELVAAEGWAAFRERERAVLEKILRLDGVIVDGGGGIVVELDGAGGEVFSAHKVDALRAAGPVVWLRGDVERLVAKVAAKADRPALTDAAHVLALMTARQAWYAAAATHVVDIEGKRREDVALEICDLLGLELAGSP